MDVHIPVIPAQVLWAYGFGATAIGWWRGGCDAKVVGALVVAQIVSAWATPGIPPPAVLVWVDGASLTVCLAVVLRSRRYWTIWATAAAFLSTGNHIFGAAWPHMVWAYRTASILWFLALATALLVGSLLTWRRRDVRALVG
jgi:hypothetical protein